MPAPFIPDNRSRREHGMSSNEHRADLGSRRNDGTLNRRSILLGGTTLAATSAFGAGTPTQVAQAQQPPAAQSLPNILFILVDNLGYGELGVYEIGRASCRERV